ncbi:MAG: enoyl-CoA hydratase/isomerase family protein [Deltaproteobacteria bacterium]|nr:enoyl-CoA hydratase/isomerase family protein [Deltaproteobacteria bacterium]
MSYERYRALGVERRDRVLLISFNRPEAMNTITAELHRELSEIFADVARDAETQAVVLTGKGPAFSAGGDLRWFQKMTAADLDALFTEARKIIVDFLEVEQPIIAAVNGAATGLGATLALFSDVIFASDAARIGDPHVRIGVVAGDGGAIIWPWLVGAARAKEFLMTGDLLSAEDAHRIGLVNHVVPAEQLLPKALGLAERLANGPIQAIRGTKVSVNKILRETVNLVLDTSLALEKLCFATQDHREAVNAFLEKRAPKFTGR